MSKTTFGLTWWGKQWLEALNEISRDVSRLPRGRSYARKGAVLDIKVNKGKIIGEVEGRRPTPYDIDISLRFFTKEENDIVNRVIKGNLSIAARLKLGELPTELFESLNEHGVKLLPNTWDEFDANCSCPDWANPCKHLTAVVYMLAGEIDKDPFLLFEIRGVKKEELLEAAGIIEEKINQDDENCTFIDEKLDKEELDTFPDLSDIAEDNVSKEILSFLSSKPLFYARSDFKKELRKTYRMVMKETAFLQVPLYREKDQMKELPDSLNLIIPSLPKENLLSESYFLISKEESVSGYLYDFADSTPEGYKIKANLLLEYLFELSLEDFLSSESCVWKFFILSSALSQSLAQSGRFIPSLKNIHENSFYILYEPFFRNSSSVKKVLKKLTYLIPNNFVVFEETKTPLEKDKAVSLFISLLLTRLVQRFSKDVLNNKLKDTFFKGYLYTPERFEEENTLEVVRRWLDELNLEPKKITPVLKIEIGENDEFFLNVLAENKHASAQELVSLKDIYLTSKDYTLSLPIGLVKYEIISQLLLLSRQIEQVNKFMRDNEARPVKITSSELLSLLNEGEKICKLLNIKIMIPKELQKLIRPKTALKAEVSSGSEGEPSLTLDKLTEFSYQVALGDSTISFEEFMELVDTKKEIVRFKDKYVFLDPNEVKELMKKLEYNPTEPTTQELVKASLSGTYNDDSLVIGDNLSAILNKLMQTTKLETTPNFEGFLRHYQNLGFSWLYKVTELGLGCCLADDMGLGKTIQLIAMVSKLAYENKLTEPVLIICPTSLLGNWKKEFEKFAPSLKVDIYYGNKRRLSTRGKDVILTTYTLARKEENRFKRKTWSVMAIDEAQNIKNPVSQQTKAIKSIPAKRKIALTGTPVENSLAELWSIFDFINKGYLGSKESFRKTFATPIERYRDANKIETLNKITSPFIMRRAKTDKDIVKELPDKIEKDEYCSLKKEQAALYQQLLNDLMEKIAESDDIERKGMVFKLITSLKQICNHPVQYTKRDSNISPFVSGKSQKTLELVKDIISKKEKVLIFTQYKEAGDLLKEMLASELEITPLFFHGGVTRKHREEMIDDFKKSLHGHVMIISLKAGGTGLNLTEAAYVIHYDLWWNPAVENQATDRTHRIGQAKQVQVYRLITKGTFEEKINDMLNSKKELFDLVVSGSSDDMDISKLSDEELYQLVSLQYDSK
ncbi:SNF2-related protein [Natranaerobius trueperi]|uniref:Helicase SNF2 n=1 Tax=Natranaerobius trueperi TaxID=759412 RepID=A0A226BXT8_9FIRM|nr:SNF2-related protein [Natranaerobius trueperi]OWZ83019.1 hypothetical protein CDO51_10995 [Natranaerobius trueperi]